MTTPIDNSIFNYICILKEATTSIGRKYILIKDSTLDVTDKIEEASSTDEIRDLINKTVKVEKDKRKFVPLLRLFFNVYCLDTVKVRGFKSLPFQATALQLAHAFGQEIYTSQYQYFYLVSSVKFYSSQPGINEEQLKLLETEDGVEKAIESLEPEDYEFCAKRAGLFTQRMNYYLESAFNQALNHIAALIENKQMTKTEIALKNFLDHFKLILEKYKNIDSEGSSINMELAKGTLVKKLHEGTEPLIKEQIEEIIEITKETGTRAIKNFFRRLILQQSKFYPKKENTFVLKEPPTKSALRKTTQFKTQEEVAKILDSIISKIELSNEPS